MSRFMIFTVLLTTLVSSMVALGAPRSSAAGESLVPLYSWYSPSRGDYFATTNPQWRGAAGETRSPDYQFVRIEGMVFSKDGRRPSGTVPLYHWYSATRGDNFVTSNPRWASAARGEIRAGYRFVGVEGYIHNAARSGTMPLQSWWNTIVDDNYATTDPRWSGEIGELRDNYRLYRIEGYLVPPAEAQEPLRAEDFGFDSIETYGGGRAVGHRPLLVILVQYSDAPFMHDLSAFQELAFGPSYPNAVDYFRENSYGRFTWTPEGAGVVGPMNYTKSNGKLPDC